MGRLTPAAFVLALLVVSSGAAAQGEIAFLPQTALPRVPDFFGHIVRDIAVSGAAVRVVWDGQLQDFFGFDWGLSRSSNSGATFTSVRAREGSSELPGIQVEALPDDAFGYIWYDRSSSDLVFAIERAGSGQIDPRTFSNAAGQAFDVAADDGGFYVAWVDDPGGNAILRVTEALSPNFVPQAVTSVDTDPLVWKGDVRLCVFDGTMYVAWTRLEENTTRLYFAEVGPSGLLAGPFLVEAERMWRPSLAVAPNGTLLLVYETMAGIRAVTASSPYISFSPLPSFRTAIGGNLPVDPRVAFSRDGRLHVAWLDGATGNQTSGYMVMYTSSGGSLTEFPPPVRLDDGPSTMGKVGPELAFGGDGRVFVAWGASPDESLNLVPYVARSVVEAGSPDLMAPGVVLTASAGAAFIVVSLLRRKPRHAPPTG